MPQTAAAVVVVAKAVDTTDVSRLRCDVAPASDTGTLDQQEHDLWLKAKQQELARLQQQQIVTNTVKTLQQLLEIQLTQRLAVQSHCRLALHSSGGTVGGILPEAQMCVGLTACSIGSSNSCVGGSPSGSSPRPTDTSSSSSSSRGSTADDSILTAELEVSTDESTASAASHDLSPAASQLDCSEHSMEAVSQAALNPLQQAATAAAAAALAGITSTQASSRRSSSIKDTSTAPRCGNSWPSNRQPAATGVTAAAPRPIKAPCSLHSSIGDDSPRSTCTGSSSRSASSRIAPSRNGHDERAYGRTLNSRRPCRQQVSTAAALISADNPADAPPGFGATVQQIHGARGPQQQPQPAAPPPPGLVAARPTGPPPPGFAAAVDAPPGFGGMTCVGSGYIQRTHPTQHRPPTLSRSESPLGSSSYGGAGARSSSNTRLKTVGPSRLFQGALAGAVAERR